MNLIIEDILPENTAVPPEAERDTVEIEWYEADRRILRKTTASGRDVAFRLLREGQRLAHGDLVHADNKLAINVAIKPSEVIVLSPKTLPDMARVCYEIGNKHSPLFLDGNEVIMPYDKPMFLWLEAAGFQPKQDCRRLSHALKANSAQGAGGHSHHHHAGHHHHEY
ncbi:MAG: urease accessory protein UreE [Neisseria sp.]|uniref:urease accessory protein UreE n=1 Tax=Neisseria sp. TaxID=192066 RepID=UPI0026DC8816|nr:urease accessory protein UreE [Neisseria sp.]MDO4641235.1 urease accessory protein UreE [Neisseria sp.]